MPYNAVNSKISCLPGLSTNRAALIEEHLNCHTIEDLLYYFPRRYLDRTITQETYLQPNTQVTIIVQITSVYLSHGRQSRLMAHCDSLQGTRLTLVWFRGTSYFHKLLQRGISLVVSGKIELFRGLQIIHPEFEILDANEKRQLVHTGRIIPLYPTSDALKKKGLDSRGLRKIVLSALNEKYVQPLTEILPQELLDKHKLMGRQAALHALHFPSSLQEQEAACHRIKYEELYLFQVLMFHKALFRQKIPRQLHPIALGRCTSYQNLIDNLPFTLTKDQETAIRTILQACQNPYPGAFLLQGDVGSGKTLVSLGLALHYLDAGIQTALMAPTEVLARQHFLTITELLGLGQTHKLELLTGSDGKKERLSKLERISTGEAGIVVGTHSLMEDSVIFHELGLVIIDEQHRFGVKQRDKICSKGKTPDTLAMSATPIPRSLCLTEFADLELVTLQQKPAGRKAIRTMWLPNSQRKGVYNSIRKYVNAGRQCYIVYPLIEESEKIDLQAATIAYENLTEKEFPQLQIALLHGRMKPKEKQEIMQKFKIGKIQILVTTSVIEVGVDVPNATIMVIEHAERFGISQLHQLRGRVGRGSEQSYCAFLSDAQNFEAQERLQALVQSNDGFYLAEMDLKLRGTGEVLGLKQHGLSDLRLANLIRDKQLTELAYSDAQQYSQLSPQAKDFLCRRFSQGIVIFPN